MKKSNCAFVVIKLKIGGEEWLIMRKNQHWKDINFVGGHQKSIDKGNNLRTAKRELQEEIPALRTFKNYKLEKLTNNIEYGPVESKSARSKVEYNLQFYLVRFIESPNFLCKSLNNKSANILISLKEIKSKNKFRISGLADLLNLNFPGGLESIPLSWPNDLDVILSSLNNLQQEFAWN